MADGSSIVAADHTTAMRAGGDDSVAIAGGAADGAPSVRRRACIGERGDRASDARDDGS
jgi:hypothetical protein